MRQETLEQILKVVSVAAQRYRVGDGIDHSYQYGVSRVSEEYEVAYQTIGDACRRRLGLDHVGEFKTMLKASFEGDTNKLRDVLLSKTSRFYHDRIKDFFSTLTNNRATTEAKEKEPDTFVTYTVKLRKRDSDVLMALAQLSGGQPEEILVDASVEAIKDRMKKAVNKL
jgi:DNA polymerase elongation subunit (family B)